MESDKATPDPWEALYRMIRALRIVVDSDTIVPAIIAQLDRARGLATAGESAQAQGAATSSPDTPLLAAKRRAFDYPSIANLDALVEAATAAALAGRENVDALVDAQFDADVTKGKP